MKIFCPVCKKTVQWEENLYCPFCSERCKLIDLGHWAAGAYALPTDEVSEDEQAENQT